jgi:hypothetical protein
VCFAGSSRCDELIASSEQSCWPCVSNCLWSRNLKAGGEGPICAVATKQKKIFQNFPSKISNGAFQHKVHVARVWKTTKQDDLHQICIWEVFLSNLEWNPYYRGVLQFLQTNAGNVVEIRPRQLYFTLLSFHYTMPVSFIALYRIRITLVLLNNLHKISNYFCKRPWGTEFGVQLYYTHS